VSLLGDFKKFLMRGNLVELAVAFVMGVVFAALLKAFIADPRVHAGHPGQGAAVPGVHRGTGGRGLTATAAEPPATGRCRPA